MRLQKKAEPPLFVGFREVFVGRHAAHQALGLERKQFILSLANPIRSKEQDLRCLDEKGTRRRARHTPPNSRYEGCAKGEEWTQSAEIGDLITGARGGLGRRGLSCG